MNNKVRTVLICVLLSLCCTIGGAQNRVTPQQYIDKYKHLAIIDQEIYGIPASITMAQGLLESDCGNRRLAVEGNNHFGIKCKRYWTGMTITHDDDEKGECFRKYETAEDSYRDHSEFLDMSDRYQFLFDLEITDYKGWAHGLKKAGYATNPRYAELLIKVIEENKLYLLDTAPAVPLTAEERTKYETPDKPGEPLYEDQVIIQEHDGGKINPDDYVVAIRSVGTYPIYHNNGAEFVTARPGDTYESLSTIVGVKPARLRKFNDAAAGYQPYTGEPVYLKAKGNRANSGKLIHIAAEGESLRSVAQRYGIKLGRLASLNRRPADSVLRKGEQVRLM